MKKLVFSLCLCASVVIFAGCAQKSKNRVVLYCSVDQVAAKPIIADLEKRTGLQIDVLFDTEAAKTAGLANKIRAEKNRPRGDVFWSSALLQTLLLSREGFLAAYQAPADLPPRFQGKDWAGVGLRARVLVSTTPNQVNRLSFVPLSLEGRFAISNPQFGTASDWAAAYGAQWGQKPALDFFRELKKEGVKVLPGNADVALGVANNQLSYGVTDSDDFLNQTGQKKPIFLVKTLKDNVVVPGSAAIVKGGPNPENARKLMDALADAQTEAMLIKEMPGVFSLRHLDEKSNWQSGGQDFSFLMKTPPDDYAKWAESWAKIREPLAEILLG